MRHERRHQAEQGTVFGTEWQKGPGYLEFVGFIVIEGVEYERTGKPRSEREDEEEGNNRSSIGIK